jgi:3-deoxy-D-manno-octulosonic acid kinase
MKPWPAPDGFLARRLPAATAWLRPRTEKPILSTWQKTGTHLRLGEVTRRHPQSTRHPGRAPVHSAPFPGAGELVVRPCLHGGGWGILAGDLYLGPARVRREILASSRLSRMQIPTPEIEAVLFYPAGPFVRMELVTRKIPESRDLVQRLAQRPGPAERKLIFSAVRKLFTQLHRHGIRHPDLNARNILLAGDRRPTAWLLDVDGVCFDSPSTPSIDTANRHRLLRSLLKRARLGDLGWSESEVAKLWRELFPR